MNTALIIIIIAILILVFVPAYILIRLYFFDAKQKQHSILRNYPLLGKARYITEKAGPELRQYLFNNDNEGKPFNRREFEYVYKAAKYSNRMIGYGSQRDFDEAGYYIVNNMFPSQREEMKIKQEHKIETKLYNNDNEYLFNRKEKTEKKHKKKRIIKPCYLTEEKTIEIGKHTVKQPFRVNGFIGQSAMSFGSLGDHAITALSKGLAMAGETWMNTGEGSISPYHQKGDVNIILQISPGLFGVRTKAGEFSWEEFKNRSNTEQIKAFELKLAQGAKQRGGHVEAQKVTEEIAQIRNVEPWETINSPNRFDGLDTPEELLQFVKELRKVGG